MSQSHIHPRIQSYSKLFEKRLFLQYIATESRPGVFAFINEKKKRIYIGYSRTIVQTMVNIAQELGNRTHASKEMRKDLKQLNFKVLEHCEPQYGSAMKVKWISFYQSLGYALYNTDKVPSYTYRTVILDESFKIQVQLYSKGRRSFPVKEFSTQVEANNFMIATPIHIALKLIAEEKSVEV